MISSKKQEPEQDQSQQFGGKSPGNLDLEVSPPVIVAMRSLNHARFQYALHYDRSSAGIRRAFIPAFCEIGFTFQTELGPWARDRLCSWPQQALCDWYPRSYTDPLESD
jgi:hypothetical protein